MKKIHIKILIFVSLQAPVLIMAQDSIKKLFSLSDCIQIALKNNLEAQRSGVQARLAHINVLQSKENLLPVFNASITDGINEGRNIDPSTNTYVNQQANYVYTDMNASLLVFNGFALQSTIKQNNFLYAAAKAKEQQVKDNLSLNVALAYLQVLSGTDLLLLSTQQRETTAKQVERLASLKENGATTPAIYYDLKGQLANDDLAVLNAKSTLENSKLSLVQLMNIYYNEEIKLEAINTDILSTTKEADPKQLFVNAEQNLSYIKTVDFNVKATAMQIRNARSGYYPSLYLKGYMNSNYSSAVYNNEHQQIGYKDQLINNIGKSVSINLVIPLFNSLRTKNAVSIAKLTNQDSKIIAEATRKQLQQLIEQAYLNLIMAKRRHEILEQQVEAFSQSFHAIETRFKLGAVNSTDYLITKNNFEKAKINAVIAKYDYVLRKKIIEFYEGKAIE